MSSPTAPRFGRLMRRMNSWTDEWNRIGEQTAFYGRTLRYTGEAIGRYKTETFRLVAQMSLGVGALAMIGGAVAIVTFLVMNTGAIIAIFGYSNLSSIGIESLTGFFSAYATPRLASPLLAAVGLAATIGAGATAQLGAMRINEEIDALEVMGIHAIAYLASTRVIAGVIVVIPLWCLSTIGAFVATRTLVVLAYGQSSGGYDHYFNTFLKPGDLVWAFVQVSLQGCAIMLVHTYYGFTASGGPAGVGEATGRAVRTSLIVALSLSFATALALYGRSGDFHLSG
jgi:phospholipid/cholesterol/gamma-HCH transport system permease protein